MTRLCSLFFGRYFLLSLGNSTRDFLLRFLRRWGLGDRSGRLAEQFSGPDGPRPPRAVGCSDRRRKYLLLIRTMAFSCRGRDEELRPGAFPAVPPCPALATFTRLSVSSSVLSICPSQRQMKTLVRCKRNKFFCHSYGSLLHPQTASLAILVRTPKNISDI